MYTRNFNRFIFILVCSLFATLSVFSQQSAKETMLMKKATEAYKSFRYLEAVKYLKQVLAKQPENIDATAQLAASYRKLKNYEEALHWYQVLSKQKELKPEWALYYAEALANNESYEESERWYRRFLSLVPADRRAEAIVKAGVTGVREEKGEWKLFYTDLNTAADEYSTTYYKNGLIFSSNRSMGGSTRHVFGWNQTPFTDLYVIDELQDIQNLPADTLKASARPGGGKYFFNDDDTPASSNDSKTLGHYSRVFLEQHNSSATNTKVYRFPSKVNSRFHEGPVAFLPEGSMIFSRNNFYKGKAGKSKQGVNKLKLYTAKGIDLDDIEAFPFNNDEYSVSHPAVSRDGNILVFASDMPGGFGGTDLYYSVRTGPGKQWGKPVNLGSRINTEGDEMFPHIYNDRLFFSSTGHPGFGGLDIFEVRLKDMKPVGQPRNLGQPFNSFADDFGLIRGEKGMSGFISSNRAGNDDIYKYEHLEYEVKLSGILIDAQTRAPLAGSKVVLRNSGIADTLYTNEEGRFFKALEKEEDYELFGKRPQYVGPNKLLSTVGIQKDSIIQVVLEMRKANTPEQWVLKNCDSLKREFFVDNIYYDLDQSFIRDDAREALDALVSLMIKHPDITVITSSHCDTRASVSYNKALSMRRGEAAKQYLVNKGINPARIAVEYYGKSRLVNSCYDGVPCTEHEQQLNRRTEFNVILNGVNLTQLDCDE